MAEPIRAVFYLFIQSLVVFTRASIIITSAHNYLRAKRVVSCSAEPDCHNSMLLWLVAKVLLHGC